MGRWISKVLIPPSLIIIDFCLLSVRVLEAPAGPAYLTLVHYKASMPAYMNSNRCPGAMYIYIPYSAPLLLPPPI